VSDKGVGRDTNCSRRGDRLELSLRPFSAKETILPEVSGLQAMERWKLKIEDPRAGGSCRTEKLEKDKLVANSPSTARGGTKASCIGPVKGA